MNLSNELISQFVKATKDTKKTSTESTVNGTTVIYEGRTYVKLDGSDLLTPVNTTTDVKSDERVTVMIKDHTATITGNLSSPSARTDDVQKIGNKITEVEILVADKVSTKELEAESARIDTLVSENVVIREQLTANKAHIDELSADNVVINETLTAQEADIKKLDAEKLSANAADIKFATIDSLDALEIDVHNLEATYGEFQELTAENLESVNATINNLDSTYASIKDLEAEQARIDILEANSLTADSAEIKNLQADVADIDTLIFGSASGTTIQTSFANAVIAQLGNAQIKSAMIDNITADKILAGDIITNNVRVMSEDGKLLISDETIQISDDARVRVQIGKDATGDYSISIWDAAGKLMFSEGGITDSAIKDAIIRNDMVASDANIAASKLDISSLFTEINNSTETINSSKILMDAENQTLDVVFTQMSSDIDDISDDVSTQGTAISVIQGQISSKVWQQDIDTAVDEFGDEIETLSNDYSNLQQSVNSLSATVGSHTTQIANKADSSIVTEVSDKVSELELGLDGFKTSVSETYATKADVSETYATKSEVTQTAENITTSVRDTYATKTDLDATDTKVDNAQNGVDELVNRMNSAETKIDQNSEAIELRATKSEVSQTLTGYYTKDETNSAINVKSDEITSTVEHRIEEIQIGSRNLIAGTSLDTVYSGNNGGSGTKDVWAARTIDPPTGTEYIVSFDAKADVAQNIACFFYSPNTTLTSESSTGQSRDPSTDGHCYVSITTEWKRYWVKWTQTAADTVKSLIVGRCYTADNIYIRAVKLEKGNKATDWTPAPEDMASTADLQSYATKTEVNQTADSITAMVSAIEIGGRNLLLNTGGDGEIKAVDSEMITSSVSSWTNEKGVLTLNCSATTTEIYYRFIKPELDNLLVIESGSTYTLSGKAMVTTTSGTFTSLIVRNQANSGTAWVGGYSKIITESDTPDWIDFVATFTVEEDIRGYYVSLQAYYDGSWDGVIKLKELKLEKGNKATDWTPAPEDMATASDIAAVTDEIVSVTESISALDVKADNISASVREIKTSTDTAIESVNSNIESLVNEVSAKMTAEAVEIEIQKAMENGASKVITSTGFTFDEQGMTVQKTGSEMKTQITEDGMVVYQNDEATLTANNKGVDARNLHATTYLIVGGRSRFENYGSDRTGCFWIGG